MALSDLYRMPGHLIRRAQQIAVSIFTDECRDFGITPVQFAILWTVRDHPGLDQITLANLVALDRSNTGDVVARLVEKGLIRREAGSTDRRTKLLHLTRDGESLLDAMRKAVLAAQERMLAPLGRDERELFLSLLAKIVDINNGHSRAPRRIPARRRVGT